ncbi:hypothetical protein TNIN_270511 [Trichonephila inaurata madagascariensis]|uniref:Uncharacterized protein n=1 Tax=Trichonephila inaurata madagascariensis TaxID=2747483 RepID=A0A8X6X8P2_9ARAC|nr:hypothetical protein TNIN_270511 [Trichonephila inaurata madagascariensis]
MFEMLNKRYPGTKDLKDVLDVACLDLTKAKENIEYYFEEKDKLEACLALIVAECQIKKSMMGLFGR